MKTHEMQDWLKAGTYYRTRGNFEKALESFAQARLALLCEMGECLVSLGKLEEGQALFEEVLEANPANARANAGMGIIFLLKGNYQSADTAFGNVLHGEPHNAKALCGLGLAKKGSGQEEESYQLLHQSLEQDADQKTALQALAELATGLGRTQEVLALLRRYAKRHPDDGDIAGDITALEGAVPAVSASSQTETGQLRAALEAFRTNPDDPRRTGELIALLRRLGRHQEAKDVQRMFVARNPGSESALLQF